MSVKVEQQKVERKVENLMRYDSNPFPHILNWQQDLQKRADEKRATAEKLKKIIEKGEL